jgi:alpha-L-rhamnosidase
MHHRRISKIATPTKSEIPMRLNPERMAGIPLKLRVMVAAAVISFLVSLAPFAHAESPCAPTGLLCDLLAHPEETVITTATPEFGWIYNPTFPGDVQAGYRIIVASDESSAIRGTGDVWDSGVVKSPDSINVPYGGTALQASTDYFWRVQTVDSSGQTSPFSAIQHFHTDTQLAGRLEAPPDDAGGSSLPGLYYQASSNIWANRYPLHFEGASPVLVTNTAPGRWFMDFGQDAFSYVTVQLPGVGAGTQVQARFGEMADGFAVKTNPPARSLVRYTNVDFTLPEGAALYSVRPPIHHIYNPLRTIEPPKSFGSVMPFRYFELINFPGTLTSSDLTQERLLSEFDTHAASFECSSPVLNAVWNLCRNSMQILAFDGIYVDGDRERTPYEADAYINQMSAYAVNPEFTMPRYTFEYLLQNPTWPTEWKFHMIFIAWADYLETGNSDLISRNYEALKPDLLAWAATGNGLIKGFPGYPQKTNSDVVDWPVGDRDGFIIKEGRYLNWTNSVNNAFYYRSLQIMANIAMAIGRTNDATSYKAMAAQVYKSYNQVFWDKHSQSYVDGVGTTHSSAHANFFPLAFGLVPAHRQAAVVKYLHSRITADDGMPPSVYGAQYMLEALFNSGDTDTALELMTTNGPRSWLNMINMGSTITTEAWNFADKPNLDWNHAWGAAPGNLITRFVLGVRPITPGYGQIVVQPQLGQTLSYAQGTVPTIRGPVSVQVTNAPGAYQVIVTIPGNVTATVELPVFGKTSEAARVDGKMVQGTLANGWLSVPGIGSGRHIIVGNE